MTRDEKDTRGTEAHTAHTERTAIVEAAWRWMATHGPEISAATVARDAGVSSETLHHHFPTPQDLLIGVADEFYAKVMAVTVRHADGWKTPARAERTWRSFVHELADLGIGALSAQFTPAAAHRLAPDLYTAMRPRQERLTREVRGVLQKARSNGLISDNVTTVSFMLGIAAISRPIPVLPDSLAARQQGWMVETYLRGLRP